MAYQGFCEKYGAMKVHLPGHAVPVGLYALQAHFTQASVSAAAHAGFMMSCVGMICAAAAVGMLQEPLRRRQIGRTRGGQIVRRTQAAIFALAVGAPMVFDALSAYADRPAATNAATIAATAPVPA